MQLHGNVLTMAAALRARGPARGVATRALLNTAQAAHTRARLGSALPIELGRHGFRPRALATR